jgi:long-chain acyl-CoA synthetase
VIRLDEAAIARAAGEMAAGLRALGCGEGNAIAIRAESSPELVAARDAVAAIGAVAVPVSPRLAAQEVTYMCSVARARMLASAADLPHVPAAPGLATVDLAGLRAMGAGAGDAGVGPGIGATILFTSGTTGRPKGCLRTEAQEAARVAEIAATYGVSSADVHLVACPLFHSAPGAFLRAARRAGAATVLLGRFAAADFLSAMADSGATLCFLVPTQVQRLLALASSGAADAWPARLRALVVGGAPFPPAARRRLLDWLGPGRLWELFGSSETGTVTVLPPAAQERAVARPGFVGWPVPGVELRLADDGELLVRSPTVMSGYLGDDPGPWRDGFLAMGDVAELDGDGGVTLVDRKHDTIISGGMNVYPAEVERALADHPQVRGAVVCGVPDPDWGEVVAALVAIGEGYPGASAGAGTDEEELRAFLRERIAGYKIPKRIVFVAPEDLPLGPSGKPLRRAARARLLGRMNVR